MTFQEKRKYKKLAKRYFTLAYILTAMFVPGLILTISGIAIGDEYPGIWATISFVFMLAGLGMGAVGQNYLNFRIKYKMKIKEFRERTNFIKALDSLRINDYDTAIYRYNLIQPGSTRKKFLYGYFIGMSLNSNDAARKNVAEEKFNNIRKEFDPLNILI